MIYVTASIDWRLALVALAVAPLLAVLTLVFRRRLRAGWTASVKRLESSALSVVQEVLTGLRVVKAFGQEDREHERFVERSFAGMRARIRLAAGRGLLRPAGRRSRSPSGPRSSSTSASATCRTACSRSGSLLLVMGYLAQLYEPLQHDRAEASRRSRSPSPAPSARSSLLDEAPEVAERPDARPLDARGSGRVRSTSRSRTTPERPVLDDVSFVGAPGRTRRRSPADRRRQDDARQPADALLRPDRRRDPASTASTCATTRWPTCATSSRSSCRSPVLFSTTIAENIAYAPARTRRTTRSRRRACGERPRLHLGAARRLRHPRRRAGHAAVGRRAPAHLARPRLPEGRADPDPRRADELGRRRDRGRDHGGDGAADGGPDRS